MKIKSIAGLCKKSKCVFLYDKAGEDFITQWVGDGRALYPIFNIPYMEPDSILTIFEFNEKQKNDFMIRHAAIPEGINFEDADKTERILQKDSVAIAYAGKCLLPLYTSRGMVFIDSNHLAPLGDVWSVMDLYERISDKGNPYIVAKAGFLLYAIIMPTFEALNESFVKRIEILSKECRIAYDIRELARIEAQRREPMQQSLKIEGCSVDGETGEIMESDPTEAQETPETPEVGQPDNSET